MNAVYLNVFAAAAFALCATSDVMAAQKKNAPKLTVAQRMAQIEQSPAFLRAVEWRKAQLEDMRVVAASGLQALTGQMENLVGAQFGVGGISGLAGEYNQAWYKPTRAQAEASLRGVALAQGVLGSSGMYAPSVAQEDYGLPSLSAALDFWCGHKPRDTYRLCASYKAWVGLPELPPVMETAFGEGGGERDPLMPPETPAYVKLGKARGLSAGRPVADVLSDLNAAVSYILMTDSYAEEIAKFGSEAQIRAAKPISPVVMNDAYLKKIAAGDRAWVDPAVSLKNMKLVWGSLAKLYVNSDADIVNLCESVSDLNTRYIYCGTYLKWREKILADGTYLGGYEDVVRPAAQRAPDGARAACAAGSCPKP